MCRFCTCRNFALQVISAKLSFGGVSFLFIRILRFKFGGLGPLHSKLHGSRDSELWFEWNKAIASSFHLIFLSCLWDGRSVQVLSKRGLQTFMLYCCASAVWLALCLVKKAFCIFATSTLPTSSQETVRKSRCPSVFVLRLFSCAPGRKSTWWQCSCHDE